MLLLVYIFFATINDPTAPPIIVNRVLGEITRERLAILRLADDIMIQEITAAGVYREIGQAFVVLLPVKSVGVMGDCRTYEQVSTFLMSVRVQSMYMRTDTVCLIERQS